MAIYGTGYRALTYRQVSDFARIWPIARGEYLALFRRWPGIVLFIACLLPGLFNLGVMFLQAGIMQVGAGEDQMATLRGSNPRMDSGSIEFFLTTIAEAPSFIAFVVLSSLSSSRSIAKDREAGALELYWTRCVEPQGYFLAKWIGSCLLVGTMTVGLPLLTWLLGGLLAPDWGYFESTLAFVPRTLVALALFTALLTTLAVMLSAVAATANLAAILWFSLLIGSAAVGRVLARVFEGAWWLKAINPWDASKRVAEWICGFVPREDYAPGYALVSLLLFLGLLGLWTARRMRRSEAIG